MIPVTDAADLLDHLVELQRKDPRWFVEKVVDKETKQLLKLFWMTPHQTMQAAKLHSVVLHDNTYKSSKYNLALGLFASVNHKYECM
mmetsp:Transcript_54493/g.96862  ORF Transcript_54493/g.96862 Transcript_54493/m.96862 type:complete len:87 (+) Transcript_54493:192-452(+)